MNKYIFDVTVIILTYNSNYNKFIHTIKSVINQKNINMEIIIADDGSKKEFKYNDYIDALKAECKYPINYIDNQINQGTIANCLSALKKSTGKYVYLISPGDYLFDENTLGCFYRFAKNKCSKIAFGNALNYSYENNKYSVFENTSPSRPYVYSDKVRIDQRISFLWNDRIVGPSYLREKLSFETYLYRIKDCCKYIEDTTTTCLYLFDGNKIDFYNRYILWYECTSGISCEKNSKWSLILKNELDMFFYRISKEYNSQVLKAFIDYRAGINKPLYIMKYPIISFKVLIYRLLFPKKRNKANYKCELNKLYKITKGD